MKRLCHLLIFAVALAACSDDSTSPKSIDCQSGKLVEMGGTGYCVFRKAITEEGFTCPPDAPMLTDVPDYLICGDGGGDLTSQEIDEIIARAESNWLGGPDGSGPDGFGPDGGGPDVPPDVRLDVRPDGPVDAGPGPDMPPVDVGVDGPTDAAPFDSIYFDNPQFFDLPINSIRYAVSGYDSATDLCITAVWFLEPTPPAGQVCAADFAPENMYPYFIVAPGEQQGCWDYGPNATIVSSMGCVDWAAFGGAHTDFADLEFQIDSPAFSGIVRFDNTQ